MYFPDLSLIFQVIGLLGYPHFNPPFDIPSNYRPGGSPSAPRVAKTDIKVAAPITQIPKIPSLFIECCDITLQ